MECVVENLSKFVESELHYVHKWHQIQGMSHDLENKISNDACKRNTKSRNMVEIFPLETETKGHKLLNVAECADNEADE